MSLFSRIRRSAASDAAQAEAPRIREVPEYLLPRINQRVTIAIGDHSPVPTRVEDLGSDRLIVADPAMALQLGDHVVMSWESEEGWFSLTAPVLGVAHDVGVPVLHVANAGRLNTFNERRRDVRRMVTLPMELRVRSSRAVRPGRALDSRTVEISGTAIRFITNAPFAPGDVIEARIRVGEALDDVVGARLHVVRLDALNGSWRQHCTAVIDEMLRSDRARLLAVADTLDSSSPDDEQSESINIDVDPTNASHLLTTEPMTPPPTEDGVGGRDEPAPTSAMAEVFARLRGGWRS